jgi:hypothetical protein
MKRIHTKKVLPILLGIFLTALSGCGESQVKVLISPRTVTIPTDQLFPFTVEVTDTPDASVTWCVLDITGACAASTDHSGGDIDPTTGVYTPPAVIPTPNTVTIHVASNANPSATDTAVVTLVSGNTLRFGENFQITNYVSPPGCIVSSTCKASTFSSGQHSTSIHQELIGTDTITYVFMVWADNHLSNPNNDIFFQQIILDPNNTDSTKRMILGPILQVDNSAFTANRINPSLAVYTNGDVYIAWQDNRNPLDTANPKSDYDIYVAKGTFDITLQTGQTAIRNGIVGFGSDVILSDDQTGADQSNPSVATDGSNIYVAWQDNQSGSYDIRFAKGIPTMPTATTPPQNSFSPSPKSVPVTDQSTSGDKKEPSAVYSVTGIYVAWTDGRNNASNDIYIAKSTTGGADFNALIDPADRAKHNIRVNDDMSTLCYFDTTTNSATTNCYSDTATQQSPSLTVDTAGYVYVAWEDNRDPINLATPMTPKTNSDIYFAKSINGGASFDAATVVYVTVSGADTLTLTEHNIRVNDDTATNGFLDDVDQLRPSIAVENPEPNATLTTPDKIYIAWEDNRLGSQDIITAKSLDGGNTFRTNSAPVDHNPATNPNSDPSITVDTFGRAYLIWTGTSGAGTDVFFAIGQ